MKTYIQLIISVFILSLPPLLGFGQDLMSDLNRVSNTYKTNENFVFEWYIYTVDNPLEKELFIIKTCGDIFYMKGNGEISCINGMKQIAVNTAEKFVFYIPEVEKRPAPDPMNFIRNIISPSYAPKLIEHTPMLKKYKCFSAQEGIQPIEIWIDTKNWRVLKVIQHLDEELEHGFVFEFKDYRPYCEIGPETSIQSYVRFDKNQNPYLIGQYANYKLYTEENFNEN